MKYSSRGLFGGFMHQLSLHGHFLLPGCTHTHTHRRTFKDVLHHRDCRNWAKVGDRVRHEVKVDESEAGGGDRGG